MSLALALLTWTALTMQRVQAAAIPPPENVPLYVAYTARQYLVPVDLAVCTAFVESRFAPDALGDWQDGAPRARGVWQWHAESWRLAVDLRWEEPVAYRAGAHDVARATTLALGMMGDGYADWWTGWRVCGGILRGEER
jgi:hypothetical protein